MLTVNSCPQCSEDMEKVLYMGLPMKICSVAQCSYVDGFWSWVLDWHFNGVFVLYRGSYLKALWRWLTDAN